MDGSVREAKGRWLMLIHQIPPKPNYLRVKIGRRLVRIGAVALKNTVYVLPNSDSAREDFQWVLREVVAAGGDATLVNAHLVDGLADAEVEELFRSARDSDYAALTREAREVEKGARRRKLDDDLRREIDANVQRLERRLEEIAAIDFFGASGRESVQEVLAPLRARLVPAKVSSATSVPDGREKYLARTWVTRTGVHIDRIASAWLIRRFIDPDARLKFVHAKGYTPEAMEVRFDMFEAEFSHEGDLCTFEVLCARFQLEQRGLRAIAELVHDIDLKDDKFGRPEAAGVAAAIAGIALLEREDEKRLERGFRLFDELLAVLARKARPPDEEK